MKKNILQIFLLVILVSCANKKDKGTFSITGEIKNSPDQKIYLEQLFFNQNTPEIVDSAEMKKGVFTLKAIASEEGLYRIKFGKENGFIFINDKEKISFTADLNELTFKNHSFSTPANQSLKKFILSTDSLIKQLKDDYAQLNQMNQSGVKETDSSFIAASKVAKKSQEALESFCYRYADTVASPVVGIMAITTAPVAMDKFILPLQKLSKRFPENNTVLTTIDFINEKLKASLQPKPEAPQPVSIGSMAPELTMPDTSGNMFSLSSLRGKYVLVDFWASWCGPCRGENPNVVAAYNKFKDKNFTVLSVSLDKNKDSWLKAIHADNLTWYHISDLKYWNCAAVGLYGFDGIPFNVLVDPQGKIIATGLREEALHQKLAEVLK